MATTPHLGITLIDQSQAQKHVTVNEALSTLDILCQMTVKDKDLTAPPGSPLEGDTYIVGAAATGAWASHDGQIAAYVSGSWKFYVPTEGWTTWVSDENYIYAYTGAAWTSTITSGGGGGGGTADGYVINVTQSPYSADNTGATNAATAIQDALDAASAAGGGTVFCPAGEYKIKGDGTASHGGVRIPSNVTLAGAGMGATVLKLDATQVGEITGIVRTPTDVANYNVGLRDLTIDGNLANTSVTCKGVFLGVNPSWKASMSVAGTVATITTYDFDTGTGAYTQVAHGFSNGDSRYHMGFSDRTLWGDKTVSAVTTYTYQITVPSGTASDTNYVWVYPKALANIADRNVNIERVEVKNCKSYGFDPHERVENLTFKQCVSHDNGSSADGWTLDGIHNSSVENCFAYNNGRNGINLVTYCNGVTVKNCWVWNNGQYGISSQRGSSTVPQNENIVIEGNHIYGNTDNGILATMNKYCTIKGNQVYRNTQRGIRVYGSSFGNVTGNIVYDNSQITDLTSGSPTRVDEIQITEYAFTGTGGDGVTYGSIRNNISDNTVITSSPAKARYGIREETGSSASNYFSDNLVYGGNSGTTSVSASSTLVVPYTGTALSTFINVKDPTYGAVGNGSTDDRVAIQAAIDAAETAGGGFVYLPKGTYIVSGTGTASQGALRLKAGVYLFGDGRGATIIKMKNSMGSQVDGIVRTPSSTSISFCGCINLTIDGNKANNPSGSGTIDGFRSGVSGSLAISSITIVGTTATVTTAAAHGLTTGATVSIFNTQQPQLTGDFTLASGSGSSFTITVPSGLSNESSTPQYIWYYKTSLANASTYDIVLRDVEVKNCNAYGLTTRELVSRLTINNLYTHDNGVDGIYCEGLRSSAITNLRAYGNTRHGINISVVSNDVDLTDCESYNNGASGSGGGCVVQRGSSNYPFPQRVNISGGSYRANNVDGILLQMAKDCRVRTSVVGNQQRGVRFRGTIGCYTAGSVVRDNSQGGNDSYAEISISAYDDSAGSSAVIFGATFNSIIDNTVQSTLTNKAKYSVEEVADTSQNNIYDNNQCSGAVTALYSIPRGSYGTELFNPVSFGGVGDGVADDTTALQACINFALSRGGTVKIPAGDWRITSVLTCYISGKGIGSTVRVSIRGESASNTAIVWDGSNDTTNNFCLDYGTSNTTTPYAGDFGFVSDIKFTTASGKAYYANGLRIERRAWMTINNIMSYACHIGLTLESSLSIGIYSPVLTYNNYGMLAQNGVSSFSSCNAIKLSHPIVGGNNYGGIEFINGDLALDSGVIEGNGQVSGGSSAYGLKFTRNSSNNGGAAVALAITGHTYFENNGYTTGGKADVWIKHDELANITWDVEGASFHRFGSGSGTGYCINNILVEHNTGGSTGNMQLIVDKCSFVGLAGYVESSSRLYADVTGTGTSRNIMYGRNYYNDGVALPVEVAGTKYSAPTAAETRRIKSYSTLVAKSGAQTIVRATAVALTFQTGTRVDCNTNQTYSMWKPATSDTKLWVPPTATRVRLIGSVVWDAFTCNNSPYGDHLQLFIKKNGASFTGKVGDSLGVYHGSGPYNWKQHVESPVLDVVGGTDYFELYAQHNDLASLAIGGDDAAGCWFELEIIE